MAKGSKRDRKLNNMVKAAVKAERKRMFDAIGKIDQEWLSSGEKRLIADLQTAIDPAERERLNQLQLKEQTEHEVSE